MRGKAPQASYCLPLSSTSLERRLSGSFAQGEVVSDVDIGQHPSRTSLVLDSLRQSENGNGGSDARRKLAAEYHKEAWKVGNMNSHMQDSEQIRRDALQGVQQSPCRRKDTLGCILSGVGDVDPERPHGIRRIQCRSAVGNGDILAHIVNDKPWDELEVAQRPHKNHTNDQRAALGTPRGDSALVRMGTSLVRKQGATMLNIPRAGPEDSWIDSAPSSARRVCIAGDGNTKQTAGLRAATPATWKTCRQPPL